MLKRFQAVRAELRQEWSVTRDVVGSLAGGTRAVDEYIKDVCEKAVERFPDLAQQISIVALGGYGRGEMFPFSDIDIMILYRRKERKSLGEITESLLYPLWDTGLEVGHGVRTVRESLAHAEEEYFFLVALLDARLLWGDESLYQELMAKYLARFVDGHREDFVLRMKDYRQGRRERYGTHSYLLEPQIKEGRGGMRDIQAMLWTGRVAFGLRSLEDFESAGLLMAKEAESFAKASQFLRSLRFELHLVSGRKNDQLYFEQQAELAELLGYGKENGVRAVEHFMRDVYEALQEITILTDLFFDHVDEVLGFFARDCKIQDREIEKGIEIKAGRIHLTAARPSLVGKPQILCRIFLAMARTGLSMHHRSRKAIPGSIDLLTEKQLSSPRLAKTFFATLLEAKDILAVLTTMLETDVLSAVIPEYKRIKGLAQHDLYHIYTVDRHSLQTVAELHHLVAEWGPITAKVEDLRLVYLAALLHDIGKGSGEDHSRYGAGLAREIAARLSLDAAQAETVAFLVKYHLYIPENALRRDLNDSVFIKRCAELIGDTDRLAMLYLLSVADSKATGPSAWSEWKATLMEEFYLKVSPYLEHGHQVGRDVQELEEQGVAWLREQIRARLEHTPELRIDPRALGADYLLSFSPEVVVGHLLTQRDHFQRIRQKSIIQAVELEDCWSLLIMTRDRPGLLAKICGVMALNNLTVAKAQIFTWADGTVVDVLDVKPIDGLGFAEKNWEELNNQLDLAIAHRMGLSHRLYAKLSSWGGRRHRLVGEVASKVVVDNNSSENFTVIEVYAADLPAQLYYITQSLADFGINIHKAYIATEVEQLIDAFYVLDANGNKIDDEDFVREFTEGILHSLDAAKS